MINKHVYTAIVNGHCDQHHFITEGHACDYECVDTCPMFGNLMVFKLTEEEAAELAQCEEIVELEKQSEIISHSTYPDQLREQEASFITKSSISFGPGEAGSKYASTSFYYMSNSISNSNPVGNFTDEDDVVVGQSYDYWNYGKYVDVVAVEAGVPLTEYNDTKSHPDFLDYSGNQRFVPMDWNEYNVSVNSPYNNQVADGLYTFDAHAIGVLSSVGGLYSGWCKNSSLRVIYLNDDPYISVYGAVLSWHSTKPINPETGKRNANVVTGAWGFINNTILYSVPVDSIDQIVSHDAGGYVTTTNRPGATWNNDYTAFVNANIVPRYVEDDGVSQWMIGWGRQSKLASWESIGDTWSTYDGIYNFMSAGNSAGVKAGWYQPEWNTSIRLEDPGAGTVAAKGFSEINGYFNITDGTVSTSSLYYPLRSMTEGDTRWCVTVGAAQHSDNNPLMDGYSTRGPVIDISANGVRTYNAYPQFTDTNMDKWGFFGGTSNAAPQVAGVAGVILSWWYTKYGRFPSFSELRTYIMSNGRSVLTSDRTLDYTNLTGAPIVSNRLYNSNTPNVFNEYEFVNTGFELTELFGASDKMIYLPEKIRLDRIAQYHNDIHGKDNTARPAVGQAYPRRQIRHIT